MWTEKSRGFFSLQAIMEIQGWIVNNLNGHHLSNDQSKIKKPVSVYHASTVFSQHFMKTKHLPDKPDNQFQNFEGFGEFWGFDMFLWLFVTSLHVCSETQPEFTISKNWFQASKRHLVYGFHTLRDKACAPWGIPVGNQTWHWTSL